MTETSNKKVVVIGGTGLIGSKVVKNLRRARLRGCGCGAKHGREYVDW